MTDDSLLLVGIGALALIAMNLNKETSFEQNQGGSTNETPTPSRTSPPAALPSDSIVYMTDRSGKLNATPVGSVSQGINFINSAVANGQRMMNTGATLVQQNTTFVDTSTGTTYRTGANQTVQRIQTPTGPQVKVISIRTVK